ncbi:MAG: hypothetical protein HFG82_13610 [Dorea sp.]|jgi:hypothetical protein|nr:hypothetical protein [Dorea sp.]
MIIIDVEVPLLDKKYDVQIDESIPVYEVKEEITDMICRKEQCVLVGKIERLLIWDMQSGKRLDEKLTAWESGLVTGSRLMLV